MPMSGPRRSAEDGQVVSLVFEVLVFDARALHYRHLDGRRVPGGRPRWPRLILGHGRRRSVEAGAWAVHGVEQLLAARGTLDHHEDFLFAAWQSVRLFIRQ